MRATAGFVAMGFGILALLSCSEGGVSGPEASLGSLVVGAVTTGADPDPNGYVVVMHDRTRKIGANSVVTLATHLSPGSYQVELTDVAQNCEITGDNPRTVLVNAGADDRVTFAVTCQALGTVEVTTVTTGQDIDPDGYFIADYLHWLIWPIGTNDTRRIRYYPGFLGLALTGVAPNCTATPSDEVSVELVSDATSSLTFSVTCVAVGTP